MVNGLILCQPSSLVSYAMSQFRSVSSRIYPLTQLMELSYGNVQNARQSMDKNTLISICIVVLVIMSSLMGYIAGINH
jgi:hypothetical protein